MPSPAVVMQIIRRGPLQMLKDLAISSNLIIQVDLSLGYISVKSL